MIKVGINGFGRIGRTVFKKLFENKNIEVVAINDLAVPSTLAHLLKYDSVHRQFHTDISSTNDALIINGKTIPVYAEKEPAKIPWKKHGVNVVIESTGKFTKAELAEVHLKAGAEKVIL